MNEILTQGKLIDKLYSEISRQNTFYMSVISIMAAVIFLVLGFYTFQQWKFSHNGIKKMEKKLRKKFKISETEEKMNDVDSRLNKTKKTLSDINDKAFQLSYNNFYGNVLLSISGIENMKEDAAPIDINNKIALLLNVFSANEEYKLKENSMHIVLGYFSNMVISMKGRKLGTYNSEIKSNINKVFELLKKQSVDDEDKNECDKIKGNIEKISD